MGSEREGFGIAQILNLVIGDHKLQSYHFLASNFSQKNGLI